jgi:endoribonuclease Dicer
MNSFSLHNFFFPSDSRKYSEGGKRSIFLVNTVCLAKQQAAFIAEVLPYNVAVLCGENNVDNFELENWLAVLEKNEILVATVQVILDAINHRYIKMDQINVIVFDECHHGREKL